MSRLIKIERAVHRFGLWFDRVILSPPGLVIAFCAVWAFLWALWIQPA